MIKILYICIMNSGKGNLSRTNFICLVFCWTVFANGLMAQSNWKEAVINQNFYSGVSMACADVNGDDIDDILVLDQSKHLWLGINNGFAHFYWTALPFHKTSLVYSINVADIDKNGYNDILISGESMLVSILYQNKSGFQLSIVDDANLFTQAACIFDYNQDGWLDYTLTDDNGATRTYTNNGSGMLIRDTVILNLNLSDRSKNGGNYGCIWTDFDWDGDPDLYISKCKPGVDDPADLRRVNLFYVKDSGQWTERAAAINTNLGDQSWVSVFEDFDNDGLFDLFVINHYTPCRLLKQLPDHTFEDRTIQSGLNCGGIELQVMAFDVDNDGDIDIVVTGTATEFWLNDGNMNFVKEDLNLSENPFSSCAAGDYNNDGFLDLYASYASLLNAPGNKRDKLWLNPGNQNHFITFSFKGSQSNNNGIGVKIKLFTGNKLQVRELHGGESYGIQNSLNLHFGLGNSNKADSIVVFWPSGHIDHYYNLNGDQKYLLNESTCLYPFNSSTASKEYSFCDKVDTSFYADPRHISVVWNNGVTGPFIKVNTEGVYFYTAKDNQNCFLISNPNSIRINPVIEPRLNVNFSKILCEGEILELKVDEYPQVRWSTDTISDKLLVSDSGQYFGSIDGYCKTEYTDTLTVLNFKAPAIPLIQPDTIYSFTRAELKGNQENIKWYESRDSIYPLYTGKDFITDTLFASRSFWAESFELHSYGDVHGGPVVPSYESTPYHANFINNQMLFNVYRDLVLDSVTVFTDDPGERRIRLFDAAGNLLDSTLVQLGKGKSQLYLGYHVPAAKKAYRLTTSEEQNLLSLGTKSPKLYRSDKDFYYPFFIEDKLRILTSDKGDSYFYYFYDWVIRAEDEMCVSDRIEVPVLLSPDKTDNQNKERPGVHIVEGNQLLFFGMEMPILQLDICNLEGRVIQSYQNVNPVNALHISSMTPGIYFCRFITSNQRRSYSFRIVVF